MEFGVGEILVILVILVLLFGPTKLPKLGDSLGRGIRNFKKAVGGHEEERPPGRASPPEPGALPEGAAPRPQAEMSPKDEATTSVRR